MGSEVEIVCSGHPNVTATHTKTLELTRDAEIGAKATCVIGVDADYDDADVLALRGPVHVDLVAGGKTESFDAVVSPFFVASDSLVIRRGARLRERTFAFGASKAAADLDRALVGALADGATELRVVIRDRTGAGAAEVLGARYVVPLPIGNDADLTPHAIDVLQSVDVVLAEDTRKFRALTSRTGIDVRAGIESFHIANEAERVRGLVERLTGGVRMALVTDAGTPGVSDPGYLIVRAAIDAGIGVRPLAGASAVTIALSGSGLPSDVFTFAGFLPRRGGDRRRALNRLGALGTTLVLFEAPRRLVATLADIETELGDRDVCLAHDVTKIHEEFLHGTPGELHDEIETRERVLGEWTIVIAPPAETDAQRDAGAIADLDAVIKALLEAEVPARTIADALRSGGAAGHVYKRVLGIKDALRG